MGVPSVVALGNGPDPNNLSSSNTSYFDTFMSDTAGVLYRAATGKVDPWTQNEIDQQGAAAISAASNGTISYDDALAQVQQQSDQLSQNPSMTWSQAATQWVKNTVNDDGTGCNFITNPGGCFPSWLPWVVGGAAILLVLWVLRPYIVAAEEA